MTIARTKKLTDSNYSATIAASEEAIRSQVDGSIQEVLDLGEANFTNKNGDHLGTWQGLQPTQAEPGLSATVEAHLAEMATVERYGAHSTDEVGYENFDSTAAIKLAIADSPNGVIHFTNKNYKVTDEVLFYHGQTIFAPKGLVLDGTDFVGANGICVLRVSNTGDDYTALPALTVDVSKGDMNLTFVSAHNLAIGDIICLYDNTDYSWSSFRAPYKKSEFCQVASVVSDTEVLLTSGLYDSYDPTTNVNFGVYKMNMGTFDIIGSLEVIQGKQGNYYAAKFDRVKDLNISKIKGYANNGSYTAISLHQCYNPRIFGTAIQEKLSGLTGDYGLAISNCQHVYANGYFCASRHGITTGGQDGVGAIICRDINLEGTVKTNGLGNTIALGYHGNIEDAVFKGTIYGGANISGKNTKIDGTVYADVSGTCIYASEIRSFQHDLSGCKLIGNAVNPVGGIFNWGQSGASESDYMEGGLLNLQDIDINATSAWCGVNIRMRNTNLLVGSERHIRLSGKIVTSNAVGSVAYRIIDTSSGMNFKSVNTEGTIWKAEQRVVSNVDLLFPEKQRGVQSFVFNTSVKTQDITVTFPQPYQSGYIPTVTNGTAIGIIGAAEVLSNIASVTQTGFTIRVYTKDGTNFSSAVTGYVRWSAQ
jgi:hypothetical protein